MITLVEIETAVPHLVSALELPPLRLGQVLQPLTGEDDLLEEMREEG